MDQVHPPIIIYYGHGIYSPEPSEFWSLDRERHQTDQSIFAYTMYPGVFRTAHHQRRGLVMCNGGYAALARRPSLEFGVLEDEGEMTEADRKADVCWSLVAGGGGRGFHMVPSSARTAPCRVPCHGCGCPRRILIRSEKREGPFPSCAPFLGYILAEPPCQSVLRIRNPFSSPQLSFYHDAAIGVRMWDM